MHILDVNLAERSYPIFIGSGVLADPECYRSCRDRPAFIVSNEIVAPLYRQAIEEMLGEAPSLTLPDGESYKTSATLEQIYDALFEAQIGRDGCVIALGGGVIGDLAGFAAATWQRGIDVVQVPTTLLAQVDASVGGKTAVNHPRGKNLIGAFHQPRAVLADLDTLNTLQEREFRAGLAEVIKYGVIADNSFFAWLESSLDALLNRDPAALARAVETSCAIKARIVAADEHEHGTRALLNLGHTFGHAIETGLGHGSWLHGEAVAAGIRIAAELAARTGRIDAATAGRIRLLLERAGLPVAMPSQLDWPQLAALMRGDKKTVGGQVRYVLPTGLGRAEVTAGVTESEVRAAIEASRE